MKAYSTIVITVSGQVTAAANPAILRCWPWSPDITYPQAGTYGPHGAGDIYNGLRVWVTLRNTWDQAVNLPSLDGSTVQSDTLFVPTATQILIARTAMGRTKGDVCASSGVWETHGEYTTTGSQSVRVQVVENDAMLRLEASRSYVHPGDTVTFRATDGAGVLLSGVDWAREPDSTGGDSTGACSTNPCTNAIWGNGTMRVHKNIGGKDRVARRHVTVYTSFALEADKSQAYVGDTVTFTPKLDGKPAVAARWRWLPRDPGIHDSVSCGAGDACRKAMVAEGTMWAYLSSTGGQGDSAQAFVTLVVRCPHADTTDSTVDSPNIRRKFVELFNQSNPDSTTGAGRIASDTTKGWKKERGAWIFRRGDGSYYTVDFTNYYSDECHIVPPTQPDPPEIGSRLVAVVHTHPSSGKSYEDVYGTCHDTTGNAIKTAKDDSAHQRVGHAGLDRANGGGSDADWSWTESSRGAYDSWVINKDDEVWRLPAYTSKADSHRNNNIFGWRHNSNAACDW